LVVRKAGRLGAEDAAGMRGVVAGIVIAR
jgi:hypothetical protein